MALIKDSDKIWLNRERKLDGICAEILALTVSSRDVVLLAHFDECRRQVSAALLARSISFHPLSGFEHSALFEKERTAPAIWVGLAQDFHPRSAIGQQDKSGRGLSIVVAEHYPLTRRDQDVIDTAQSLRGDVQVGFHAALTDALLVHFGSERVQRLFEQLGADEEKSLSNHLIDTAIRTAQEKITQQVTGEIPTLSAEDWFKYNLRARE